MDFEQIVKMIKGVPRRSIFNDFILRIELPFTRTMSTFHNRKEKNNE